MTDSGPRRDNRSDRRLLRAAIIAAVAAWLVFFVLLTQNGGLLHKDVFGNFYDAQADALIHGHWNVDPDQVALEGFRIGDKTYIYFGALPAVARMPIEAFTDRFDGRLTRISMLAAQTVLLAFVIRLVLEARRTRDAPTPAGRFETLMVALFVFAAGSSSTLYLAAHPWVYHEAILWGCALALGSFTLLANHLRTRRIGPLAWACVLAVAAVNTRASTGAGALAALAIVAAAMVVRLWRARPISSRDLRPVGVILAGGFIAVATYGTVNTIRFGSPTALPLDRQVVAIVDQHRQAILAANHNGMFGLKFLPTQLVNDLRPDALHFTRLFPFVDFPVHQPTILGHVLLDTTEPISSITSTEPALVLLAIIGLIVIGAHGIRHRRVHPWSALIVGGIVATAGATTINFMSNRYFTDALPLLVTAGAFGLFSLTDWARRHQRSDHRFGTPHLTALTALVLVGFGAWVNTSLGMQYREISSPGVTIDERADWLALQLRIDRKLHGSTRLEHAIAVDSLPSIEPRGTLAVVRGCGNLYRSNGTKWLLLDGDTTARVRIEGTLHLDGDGHHDVLATKTTDGYQDRIAVQPLAVGGSRLVLERVKADGSTRVRARGIPLGSRRHLDGPFDVILDPHAGQVRVSVRGQTVLSGSLRTPDVAIRPGPGLHANGGSLALCRQVAAKANPRR